MKISRVKKVYDYELKNELKKRLGANEIDYKVRRFLEDICDAGIYRKEGIGKPKLRITFLPFLSRK